MPWRQVEALLLMAAEKTSGIRKYPAARVLQTVLGDFYPEYMLIANINRPQDRYVTLSELHGHLQDVFNAHGVQIMSPNFVAQPADPIVVPEAAWYSEPAARPITKSNSTV